MFVFFKNSLFPLVARDSIFIFPCGNPVALASVKAQYFYPQPSPPFVLPPVNPPPPPPATQPPPPPSVAPIIGMSSVCVERNSLSVNNLLVIFRGVHDASPSSANNASAYDASSANCGSYYTSSATSANCGPNDSSSATSANNYATSSAAAAASHGGSCFAGRWVLATSGHSTTPTTTYHYPATSSATNHNSTTSTSSYHYSASSATSHYHSTTTSTTYHYPATSTTDYHLRSSSPSTSRLPTPGDCPSSSPDDGGPSLPRCQWKPAGQHLVPDSSSTCAIYRSSSSSSAASRHHHLGASSTAAGGDRHDSRTSTSSRARSDRIGRGNCLLGLPRIHPRWPRDRLPHLRQDPDYFLHVRR